MRRAFILVASLATGAIAVLAWAHWPPRTIPRGVRVDGLRVLKGDRLLQLLGGGAVLVEYRVSLGGQPVGAKEREGDERTPEGRYRIDYHKADSKFHRALHISYPSLGDKTKAASLGVRPGGSIMIHGLPPAFAWVGRLHRLVDWTDGCIAVTNQEIEQIFVAVPDGARIEIRP